MSHEKTETQAMPSPVPRPSGKRDPDRTRQNLLQAAFEEIHQQGFQAASLETILTHAGVTKGALYHHFANKQALGYAVVEELVRDRIYHRWMASIEDSADPVAALHDRIRTFMLSPQSLQRGCVLNNLAQEMAMVDDGFRQRLEAIFQWWRAAFTRILQQGQDHGQIRPDMNAAHVASFLVASIEGAIGTAKNAQSPELLRACMAGLAQYFATLRVPETAPHSIPQPERVVRD